MRSPCFEKKSDPSIGRLTVAIQNRWEKRQPEAKETSMSLFPKVLMEEPLAATRSVERGRWKSAAVAGYTHSSAPESTKKSLPDKSRTEMVPEDPPAAAINSRRARFPKKKAAEKPGCALGR